MFSIERELDSMEPPTQAEIALSDGARTFTVLLGSKMDSSFSNRFLRP
jgi:hypothetical protein